MKQVSEKPTSGQFAVIWEFENQIWSQTYKYFGESLLYFSDERDQFIEPDWDAENFPNDLQVNVRYFVID